MFKFLKEKLKGAISDISEKIEEEGQEEELEVESVEDKKGFFGRIKDKFSKDKLEDIPEEELEDVSDEVKVLEKVSEKKEVVEKKHEEAKIEPIKEEISETPKEEIEKEVKVVKEKPIEKESVKEEIKIQKTEVKPEVEEEPIQEAKPIEKVPEEISKPEEKVEEPIEEDKKGFFGKIKEKIVTKKINDKQFEDLFWELEVVLLENNVAVEVIEKMKEDLKKNIVDQPIKRGQISNTILKSLKETISGLFDVEKLSLIEKSAQKKPLVICFVGINGSGKTTTIAKIVKMFQNNGKSCVLAAADTFRAAAIDQLQLHANNLGVKLIKQDYGSDAAAVAFDAVKHAEAAKIDVVLIDTAGRMHSNTNLMDEMNKIVRVAKPDLKIFIGESITGNDCTEQAKKFNETIGIDGIILSKADIDEKGGAAISVSYVTGKPILYIGTGQEYNDLEKFDSNVLLESLGL